MLSKKLYLASMCAVICFSVTGCTTPFSTPLSYTIRNFMSGPSVCDPQELSRLVGNNRAFSYVRLGDEKSYVYSNIRMGAPEKVEHVKLENGARYELAFYQASSKKCEMASFKPYTHEVIAFEGDKVIGRGYDMYKIYIKPHIVTEVSHNENTAFDF